MQRGKGWRHGGLTLWAGCGASSNWKAGCVDEQQVVEEAPEAKDMLSTETAGQGGSGAAPARGSAVRSWVRDLVGAIAITAFIFLFLYQPVRVEGPSMQPGLQDDDRLFINKIAYRMGEIHRGDVVVFQYPRDHTKSYIKRVIALPGDRLRIEDGTVYVNGSQLMEPYVPNRYSDDRSEAEIILPTHEYFVMGDHRSISSDSREFGPVDRGLIYGKAVFVYWPLEQVGVVR
ncbi:MAG TPA: signal peptidase I [Acidobacteriaceae bacterium]|nr:signal peptidase I [Acidobacteriaceae bacterium]